MTNELFDRGLQTRREVLGSEYVDASIARADSFTRPIQELATSWAWGYVWNREGLDRRTRSIINLGMIAALGRPFELRLHVRGALRNGVTVDEIREILLQVAPYCGLPAALDAFREAHEVLRAEGALPTEDSESDHG